MFIDRRRDAQVLINFFGGMLALGILAIIAFLAWALVFRTMPSTNETTMGMLLGGLLIQFGIMVKFYFDGNSMMRKQAETMDKMAETNRIQTNAANPNTADVLLKPGQTVSAQATNADGTTPEPAPQEDRPLHKPTG